MQEKNEIKDLFKLYTKQWKWFLLSLVIALSAAYFFLKYSTPLYLAEAKVKIVEDENSGPGINLFKEMDIFSGPQNQVEDEIEIINSRSNMIEVVKKLNLNTQIFALGNIRDSELYGNPPVKINFLAADSLLNLSDYQFYIKPISKIAFEYREKEDQVARKFEFGSDLETAVGGIILTPMENIDRYIGQELMVYVSSVESVAQHYVDKVDIRIADEYSKIVYLSLEDPIKEKAKSILDELIDNYNANAIKDKKEVADRTAEFIDARIADISSNLTNVDQSAQDFKTERGVTDISSEANINLNVGVSNRQELANVQTQLQIASSMKDIVDQQDEYEVLPSNLGLSDGTVANATNQYNQLVQDRNRLLESADEKNPMIVNLDRQLDALRQTMQASLNSTVNNLGLQANTLSRQQAIINSKIYSAPKNERALRDITRRQQTTESLYLYLLQKKEEAQIAVASTSPKSKIIDRAHNPSQYPVSPRGAFVYMVSFVLGLVLPFSVIYIKDLLNNKIHNMHTLEDMVDGVPILGEIPKIGKNDENLIGKDDRSPLAEALRILRTNLDYLIKTRKAKTHSKNNVVFISSSVSGEGKTFVSSNLSMILSSANKKVLLIGADIRNPKIHSFFPDAQVDIVKGAKRDKGPGLTEYLSEKELDLEEITNTMLVQENYIDIIYSGKIQPNPAELLLSKRMGELLETASEKYDYVLVDTAPLMVVADTLLMSGYADHLIYITRAGVTEKNAVEYPIKLQEQGKIDALCFLVNDVKSSELGYGGQYGYGYGRPTKKWWKL